MRGYFSALVALLLWCLAIPSANAHLIVAQRGTIRFQDDGAFVVASLPATAFTGVDDDEMKPSRKAVIVGALSDWPLGPRLIQPLELPEAAAQVACFQVVRDGFVIQLAL